MKLLAALTISATLLAQTPQDPESVAAVRHWSLSDVTRVAIEVTGEFQFRSDHLHNPERVFYDILNAVPHINGKRAAIIAVDDKRLQKIRVAETVPGTTRIVLDLTGNMEATASTLTNPNRLIVELRRGTSPAIPTLTPPSARTEAAERAATAPIDPPALPVAMKPEPVAKAPVTAKSESPNGRTSSRSSKGTSAKSTAKIEMAASAASPADTGRAGLDLPHVSTGTQVKTETPAASVDMPGITSPMPVDIKLEAVTSPPPVVAKPAAPPATAPAPIVPGETAEAARRTSSGANSLIRTLGLKLNRVVLDPGHGGHDEGTHGTKLLEKDVVLDVAQRLGKLIEARMGAEVVFTRNDDTFIPLEGRTALANEKKADLFLSIHANSSTVHSVAGVETYYLSINGSKEAMDVAAIENRSSQMPVSELQDIIRKIALHDKSEESQEFAQRIQASLSPLELKNFPAMPNRGVKSAPFVVLIGANMPSVLAEIGFLSNPKEEANLRNPAYLDKIAEALYKGIEKYAQSLSHFQIAARP